MWLKKEETPKEVQTNQTQFGMEKPLFEESPYFTESDVKEVMPKKKPPFLFIGLAFFAVFLILLGALALVQKKTTVSFLPGPTPSPVVNQNVDVYKARINELQNDFRDADPAQTTLPFPPVSLGITLDPVAN